MEGYIRRFIRPYIQRQSVSLHSTGTILIYHIPGLILGHGIDGVVGFMRAIAPSFWTHGTRVNAICPGIVQTNLVDPKGWATFPSQLFIAPETIAATVLMLIRPTQKHATTGTNADSDSHSHSDGMQDAEGTFIPASQAFGRTVEISGDRLYFREQPGFCDLDMRRTMQATVVENQVGGILD